MSRAWHELLQNLVPLDGKLLLNGLNMFFLVGPNSAGRCITTISATPDINISTFFPARKYTPSATPASLPCRSLDSAEYSSRDQESSSKPQSAVGLHGIWQKVANQLPRVGAMQPPLNGFNTRLRFNHLSHSGRTLNASPPPGNFSFEAMVMHARAPSNMRPINSIQPSTSNMVNSAVTMPRPSFFSLQSKRRF